MRARQQKVGEAARLSRILSSIPALSCLRPVLVRWACLWAQQGGTVEVAQSFRPAIHHRMPVTTIAQVSLPEHETIEANLEILIGAISVT
jgi:hypothetical protein